MAPNLKDHEMEVEEKNMDPSISYGKFLADPEPGEEVCITGISGAFPNSRNLHEFRDNLMNKVDMVDGDTRRWEHFHPEIPERSGKIYDIEKFDSGFFGVHLKQAMSMEPMHRMSMEKAIEAIFDAGYHPSELEGTRTGVFAGACYGENEFYWFNNELEPGKFAMTGSLRCMIPNRLSYYLKLKGRSQVADTACSSSFYSLENAYKAIRDGECDMAIVAGTNLTLHPFVTLQFARMGVLSLDGSCKSFDESASGYARSEAIVCLLLQKAKDSRRIYATVKHAKTNCDGYKQMGISYPSGEVQQRLLEETYEESNIDPTTVSFVEAHGTGTKVGDPEECSAIDEVFCKGRRTPLLIGSVKSNIGHSEPASGMCSVAKCIIGMEEGLIPPNIHFFKAREGIAALEEGRMQVVSEPTPFRDDKGLVGINSFGFGGANCHVILEWNHKSKVNGGEPKDDLPRLVCVSGRTSEAVTSLTNDVNSRSLDAEHIQLLHEVFKKDIEGHLYRGYTIVSKGGAVKTSMRNFCDIKPGLVLAFGSFGDCWRTLAKSLLSFTVFADAIQRIHKILGPRLNITEMIDNENTKVDTVIQNVMGNVALHIGIIEILKDLKMEPDYFMGYAFGELACAFYDGSLTLEQSVLTAFEIALQLKSVNEASSTYIVHLSEAQVMKLLPPGVELLWKNDERNVVISGAPNIIEKFSESLKNTGVVVEHISSMSVTWHTKRISKIESTLLTKLGTIIQKPKPMGDKWLSPSTIKVASPEYFTRALSSQIEFKGLSDYFKDEQVIFEIGSGGFAELLKNTIIFPVELLNICVGDQKKGVVPFSEVLGSLYERGFNPQIQNLYPKNQYPVGRGTPMISPHIKWDHSKDWFVMKYRKLDSWKFGESKVRVGLDEDGWQFLSGHVIDGRTLFPATGYLHTIWVSFAASMDIIEDELTVVFENCRFKRATTISREKTDFITMVQRHSGNFEVIEGGVDIVSGKIYNTSDDKSEQLDLPIPSGVAPSDSVPMTQKDIYKELRLRGYNYKGGFKSIEGNHHGASIAWLKWEGNWVTFLDNMLQIKILQLDSRLLYVPTSIKKMRIDAKKHLKYVESFGENPVLPVYIYNDADILKCGGVEMHGIMASSIPRRKQMGEPVLEKYEFVPNDLDSIPIEQSIRVNMQIGLENNFAIKLRIVELLDEATRKESEPLSNIVHKVFGDQPLVQTEIIVLSKEKLELENGTVEDKALAEESECSLVIGSKILQRAMVLQEAFGVLKENGYILSREGPEFDSSKMSAQDRASLDILTVHNLGAEKLVYFRKAVKTKEFIVINVSAKDEEYSWLPSLQNYLKNDRHVIIYSQNEEYSGILGLTNCIRREPGGANVRCFIILDADAPPFDPKHPFYLPQMKRNMAVNIYKKGRWGTYRHLLLNQVDQIETEHCFVNLLTRGDLSSLKWIEGNLTSKSILPPEKKIVQIYYSSLNFRDVMTALGRINPDIITMDRTQQECVQGFEFSGKTLDGRRVMGMVTCGALSTMVAADDYLLWDIPESWTLEQAATVPAVYGTVLYALIYRGKIKRGDTILIHSGTGGVGLAAIYVALAYGCIVYTTVGTQEKRNFIKKLFPQLTDRHIGSSRDLSFEKMVKQETKGRGVDIVLNSLAEEKMLASIRCLARGGRFLEIGKVDMANNNYLALLILSKGCSFHGVMLDQLMNAHPSMKAFIRAMISEGIKNNFIKPLNTNVFKMNEVEQAFRFMATGKHMGKVMIEIRKEESAVKALPPVVLSKAIPRIHCHEEKSYIIAGGLGGFGLELADWLVLRGARRLVLTSRKGVQTGYQSYRISIWKTYGVQVKISTADITTRNGCEQLIAEAQELGPIESIFNLAVVLKDSLLENQSPESFKISLGPKADATKYLDEITRAKCPYLRDFVIFSSVSCGRGNAGQTNYGMANSIMERICEKRRNDGYPALAIEWGAIGDVGLVAEMMEDHVEMEIGGTLQQSITSCIQVMDIFLRQKESAVVSSIVVATKRSSGGADNIVDSVVNILGIKKETVSAHSTLAELGMDSMTAVEIKQTLEREFEVVLSAQDIRTLTLARLQEIQESKESSKEDGVAQEKEPNAIELILRYLGDDSVSSIPVIKLPSLVNDNSEAPNIFCFPGIEGVATTLKPLAANLKANVIGIQFGFDAPTKSYAEMADDALAHIEQLWKPKDPLNIIAYSWGNIIALEVLAKMEKKGHRGNLICLDGAPTWLREWNRQEFKVDTEAELETLLICHLMSLYVSYDVIFQNREKVLKSKNTEERIDAFQKIVSKDSTKSPDFLRRGCTAYLTRIKEMRTYAPKYPKISSPVRLYKASKPTLKNFAEDYHLSELCDNLIEIKAFDGNHITIMDNIELAQNINEALGLQALPTSKTKTVANGIQNREKTIMVNGSSKH